MADRGYKAWCEQCSIEKRKALGASLTGPLDSKKLAEILGVQVYSPGDVPGLGKQTIDVLLRRDGGPSCTVSLVVVAPSVCRYR